MSAQVNSGLHAAHGFISQPEKDLELSGLVIVAHLEIDNFGEALFPQPGAGCKHFNQHISDTCCCSTPYFPLLPLLFREA